MIRIGSLCLFLVFLPSCSLFQGIDPGLTQRVEFAKLNPEIQRVVTSWLQRDCNAREPATLEAQLVRFKDQLVAVFWESYRLGPTKKELDRYATQAADRYKKRQNWLRESGTELMSEQERNRQLRTTSKQYIKRETNQFIAGYKSRAIAGLGFTGTKETLEQLREIASDRKSPDQTAAQEAVNRLQNLLEN